MNSNTLRAHQRIPTNYIRENVRRNYLIVGFINMAGAEIIVSSTLVSINDSDHTHSHRHTSLQTKLLFV